MTTSRGRCLLSVAGCVIGLSVAGCQGPGPTATTKIAPPANVVSVQPVFPRDWAGIWAGTCVAQQPNGRRNEFDMELHIVPTTEPHRWEWTLVYGNDQGQQRREYELLVVDASTGRFRIDERNSIVLDGYLIGQSFHNHFSIVDAMLTISYMLDGEHIFFRLVSTRLKDPATTGGEDGVPEVLSYPVLVAQSAKLARVADAPPPVSPLVPPAPVEQPADGLEQQSTPDGGPALETNTEPAESPAVENPDENG